ncbi:MAG: di-trans,poly-cis-decaprenylcistransferase [Proteobacteria bacterium]|nr:di-trans,poly-cis-decaprenylcistransferase [Pseudomonadota bacterium]
MSDQTGALPRHIAFIMDGNGRWAKARGLPRLEGHRKGVDALHRTVDAAIEMGIEYLSFYAFSTENWQRPADEVAGLMALLRAFVTKELEKLKKAGVRLRFLGDQSPDGKLGDELCGLLTKAEEETSQGDKITVCICLNYGSRAEIVHAVKALVQSAADVDSLSEDSISSYLYTKDIPDPDLCIRTSGEQRLSNFMMWQLAYAELMFLPVAWPDFDAAHLRAAVGDFMGRERRYGKVLSA